MPMPQEYQRATIIYDQLLTELCEELHLATRNQAYTLLQSVLLVFRRRLTAPQVLLFAAVLPPMVRAIFVAGWHEAEYVPLFSTGDDLIEEVKDLRRAHNFADEHAIIGVTRVLRRYLDDQQLDAVLADISHEAADYWQKGNVSLCAETPDIRAGR
ncbi:DUF2267 domain-containing protein [Maritalea mediterranea]|uniref:DUF2267 domain-containing protein n=1 Tax=Maritalea mediterranea TaxID=2909667 RepID=A0ABS9E3H4_9HYPH|nr:DUF2267 domain-containing protein [Maritalea mediterranea]MCF4097333.1 DUF2267 domain-containing protein [Maritalea mediterranea]